MYFSTIGGEELREYLDDEVWDCVCSTVEQYYKDKIFNVFRFIT